MKDRARLRALGHQEFHVDLDIEVVATLGDKARAIALFAVDQDARSRLAREVSVVVRIKRGVAHDIPFLGVVPCVEPVILTGHCGPADQ